MSHACQPCKVKNLYNALSIVQGFKFQAIQGFTHYWPIGGPSRTDILEDSVALIKLVKTIFCGFNVVFTIIVHYLMVLLECKWMTLQL